ncbi:MAG TPA: trans-aconitate 2-methyltransferase [Mycobacteriales bacterium]|nr:trans-aconitate 2-methyltransferase [Mycobacteriales bacterium]
MWDPHQYEIYADHRNRPFHELVARIAAPDPTRVVDLGCGTGALTATLSDRWPHATVTGVDSSAEMLAHAAGRARPPRLTFTADDVRTWHTDRPVDVIVSNAVFQWVPGHPDLLPGLVDALVAGGWLAFAVPGNVDSPSHTLLADLCRSARWRSRLASVADAAGQVGGQGNDPRVLSPAGYLDRLAQLGCTVDGWETTYQQVLTGPDPVLEWMRGTALRPVLAALGPADAEEFTARYGELLRDAYPPRDYGTVLPYRRVFVVARR